MKVCLCVCVIDTQWLSAAGCRRYSVAYHGCWRQATCWSSQRVWWTCRVCRPLAKENQVTRSEWKNCKAVVANSGWPGESKGFQQKAYEAMKFVFRLLLVVASVLERCHGIMPPQSLSSCGQSPLCFIAVGPARTCSLEETMSTLESKATYLVTMPLKDMWQHKWSRQITVLTDVLWVSGSRCWHICE